MPKPTIEDRQHIKKLIEKYPEQMEVVLTPYTAKTKTVTDEIGLWATIQKHNVGWFGIKPFANNSLFQVTLDPTALLVQSKSEEVDFSRST